MDWCTVGTGYYREVAVVRDGETNYSGTSIKGTPLRQGKVSSVLFCLVCSGPRLACNDQFFLQFAGASCCQLREKTSLICHLDLQGESQPLSTKQMFVNEVNHGTKIRLYGWFFQRVLTRRNRGRCVFFSLKC